MLNPSRETVEACLTSLSVELDRVVGAGTLDPAKVRIARVARAYLSDPWDAIPDELPRGLDDDLVVISIAAEHAGIPIPAVAGAALAQIRARERHLASTMKVALDPTADPAVRVPQLLRGAIALGQKLGWSERDIESIGVAPPTPATPAPTVCVYGRTSAGKTTLLSRIIRHASPAGGALADGLRISPGAHTTRAPLVVDLVQRGGLAELSWGGPSGEGRSSCALDEPHGLWIPDEASWGHVEIPGSSTALRLLDLPGTHGHRSGPWGWYGRHGLAAADGIVLPMDRRYFRREEMDDVRAAVEETPARALAITLRQVADAEVIPSQFLEEKVLASRDFGTDGEERLRAMPVFEISRRTDASDDIGRLVAWLADLKPVAGKRTYGELRRLAAIDVGTTTGEKSSTARQLLAVLGAIRAWRATMLKGDGT